MSTEQVMVSRASASDADLIADLSRQAFYEAFAAQNSAENMDKFMREQFSHGQLVQEVYHPSNIFLLASQGKETVGYAKMRTSPMPDALSGLNGIEIARIYALQKVIGQGVGKALMQACLDIALDQRRELVWLGVWEHNAQAIGFYSKWGFKKFGEHTFMLGNDPQTDWLMQRRFQKT